MSSSGDCRFQSWEMHPYHIESLPWSPRQAQRGMKTINSNKRRSTDERLLKAPNEETILAAVPVRRLLCIYWQESLGIYNKGKGKVIRGRKGRAGFSLLQPLSVKWSLAALSGASIVFSSRAPILGASQELLTLLENPWVVSSSQDACSHRPRCESLNVVKGCALIKLLSFVSLIIFLGVFTESFSKNSGVERNCKTIGQ